MDDQITTAEAYRVLRLQEGASPEEVDAAYERLFTRYEARAESGDDAAIGMMERLNAAYDTLSGEAPQPAPRARTVKSTAAAQTGTTQGRRRSQPRPRYVAPAPAASRLPYYLVMGVAALALSVALLYWWMSRGTATTGSALLECQGENRGSVVATVNGQPVYEQDYNERVELDKAFALGEPLMGPLLYNFEGITGTRALDILKQDSLDRLINFEMLIQQSRQEGLYPSEQEQRVLIDDTRSREVTAGETFESFLKARNITECQYNRRVIRNWVYVVMADRHMPKEGTAEQRTEGYLAFICQTRGLYDVKVNLQFAVENPACTSGIAPEIPLPGITPEAPEPISTP